MEDFLCNYRQRTQKNKLNLWLQGSYLSIEQDVTEVPDDVGQFNDLFPAFLKLGCNTVALTDVPAHLWHIQILKTCYRNHYKQYSTHLERRKLTTGE